MKIIYIYIYIYICLIFFVSLKCLQSKAKDFGVPSKDIFCGPTAHLGPRLPHCWGLYFRHTHTHTHTYDRNPLSECWPRDKPLTTHHTTEPRDETPCPQWDSNGHYSNQRPQTYHLDYTVTQIGDIFIIKKGKAIPLQTWTGPEGS